MTQVELAKRLGCGRSQVVKLERGERRLTQEWMERIAAALGCRPVDLLPPSRDDEKLPANYSIDDSTERTVEFDDNRMGGKTPALNLKPNISLDELDVRAMSGDGAMNDNEYGESVVARWEVPRDLLSAHTNALPSNLKIITVIGDSMVPTILPGDRVLVNIDDRAPSPPGIFVLWDGIAQILKRVEYIPDDDRPMLRLTSDNERYEPRLEPLAVVSIQARVMGKWWWT